jgi:hypothetical protein
MLPPQTVAVWTAFLGALFTAREESAKTTGHAWGSLMASSARGVTCMSKPCPELAPALGLCPFGDSLPDRLVISFYANYKTGSGLPVFATAICEQDGSPCRITHISMGLPGNNVPVDRLSLPLSLVFSALRRWFNHPMKFDKLEKGATVELTFNWDLENKSVSFLHRESMEGMFESNGDGVTYREAYTLPEEIASQGIGPTNYFNSPTYRKWQGEREEVRTRQIEY